MVRNPALSSHTRTASEAMVVETTSLQRPRRMRTLSLISTTSVDSPMLAFQALPSPVAYDILPGEQNAFGSFAPVNSATAKLRSIAKCGGFTTISSGMRRPSSRPSPINTGSFGSPRRAEAVDDSSVDESSYPSTPSISRTSSPTSESGDFFYPSPGSASSHSSSMDYTKEKRRKKRDTLHPVLAALERDSKFCTKQVRCASCQKTGSSFPKCPRCGDMWCSRECRLVGGKRHVCRS